MAHEIHATVYLECSSRADEGVDIAELFETFVKTSVLHDFDRVVLKPKRSLLKLRLRSRSTSELPPNLPEPTKFIILKASKLEHGRPPNTFARDLSTQTEVALTSSSGPLLSARSRTDQTEPHEQRRGSPPQQGKIESLTPIPFSQTITLLSHEFSKSSKMIKFHLQVKMSDDLTYNITRSVVRLHGLHNRILRALPTLSRDSGERRVVPDIPTSRYSLLDEDESRQMQNFFTWITSNAVVREHRLVRNFFGPSVQDSEQTPLT